MRDIVPEIFISFLLVGYSVLLVALGWWALRDRLGAVVKNGIGLVLTRATATFHFLVWRLKRESLGSGAEQEGQHQRTLPTVLTPVRGQLLVRPLPEQNVQRKTLKEVA